MLETKREIRRERDSLRRHLDTLHIAQRAESAAHGATRAAAELWAETRPVRLHSRRERRAGALRELRDDYTGVVDTALTIGILRAGYRLGGRLVP